jgi:hypothetical protein
MTATRRQLSPLNFPIILSLFLFFGIAISGISLIIQTGIYCSAGTDSSRQAAPDLWSKAQVVAAQHGSRFPAPAVFARELHQLAPQYLVSTGLDGHALDRVHLDHGQQAVSIVKSAPNEAILLVDAVNNGSASKVAGAVGEIYPAITDANPVRFQWSIALKYVEPFLLLFSLLFALLAERSGARRRYDREKELSAQWRAKVPELTYGPLEPQIGFETLAAFSKDDVAAGVVRFTTERLRWVNDYRWWWQDIGIGGGNREECVPLAAGVEEIATRWVAYCTRVAHENATAWAAREEAEPGERAEQAALEERQQEHVPISPHLPTPAEIMQAFPLDRELWPALEPATRATV